MKNNIKLFTFILALAFIGGCLIVIPKVFSLKEKNNIVNDSPLLEKEPLKQCDGNCSNHTIGTGEKSPCDDCSANCEKREAVCSNCTAR